MTYKYRPLSTTSSTGKDEIVPPEQSGEKLQSTSLEKQSLKRKKETSSSDSSNYSFYLHHAT